MHRLLFQAKLQYTLKFGLALLKALHLPDNITIIGHKFVISDIHFCPSLLFAYFKNSSKKRCFYIHMSLKMNINQSTVWRKIIHYFRIHYFESLNNSYVANIHCLNLRYGVLVRMLLIKNLIRTRCGILGISTLQSYWYNQIHDD